MKNLISQSAIFATTLVFTGVSFAFDAVTDRFGPNQTPSQTPSQTLDVEMTAGDSQTTTVILEQDVESVGGEVESTILQTEIISPPAANDMPAWEQALQHRETNTTTIQNIDTTDGETDVTSIQRKTITPSDSDMADWERALEAPNVTTIITREREIMTDDGDEITTIETETIGPIPAWEEVIMP